MTSGNKPRNDTIRKMGTYKLSSQAYQDLSKIADYTLEKWGIRQSRIYRDKLHDCFTRLAKYPTIGRDASEFKEGLLRYPFEAHTIFYMITDAGILIIRILGSRMDHKQHL